MGCYLSPWDIYEDKYGCFGDNNNKKNNHNKGSEKGTFTDYNKLYVAWINEICQAKKADGSYKYGNNNPKRRSDRFVEWWMDGAQGSASNRQTYDWKAILEEEQKLNRSAAEQAITEYKWQDIKGYSNLEIAYFKNYIASVSHIIMELSRTGGFNALYEKASPDLESLKKR